MEMEWLLVCLVTLPFLYFTMPSCASQATLVPGQSVGPNQTMISPAGNFTLGFFSPENSTKHFLGVWYSRMPKAPIVWVANRESPLDSPGVFMFRGDGNLVVLDSIMYGKVIWSSNVLPGSAANATKAMLMNNGNLQVLFGGELLWQSFDHPSDTLLPGQRVSQQVRLTSWATVDDPKPGMFSVGIDPKVPRQLITWKGNATYWRSSVYFSTEVNTYFRNQSGGFFYIAYSFDADGIYFTFGASDNSIKLRAVLSPSGKLNLLRWIDESKTWIEEWAEPTNKCDFYARCGPYGACDKNGDPFSSQCKCLKGFRTEFTKQWAMEDWPGGCVREKALACDKGQVFSMFEKMKLPDHAIIFENRNMSECKSECLQNCSCTAYAYSKVTEKGGLGCLTWIGNLTDLVENHRFGQTMYIRVHRSDQGGKGHVQQLAIAIVSAIAGSLTIIFGYFLWKKTLRNGGSIGGRMSDVVRNVSAGGGRNETELPLFSLRSILAATNNFSESNKLGEGGFGPVYKGF